MKSLFALLMSALSLQLQAAPPAAGPAGKPVLLKAADGLQVSGRYYQADKPKALILLFHQARSSHAEYDPVAPRLVKLGYSALAIDQRSGDAMYGKNETAARHGKAASYLDAEPDLEAALAWAVDESQGQPVVVWGSSYSAALVFRLAARHPDQVAAVMAFSPGEYLGEPDLVQRAAQQVKVPVFVTSGVGAEETSNAKLVYDAVAAKSRTLFVPKKGGVHGSSTLRPDRNETGLQENWKAVEAFLAKLRR